MRSIMRHSTRTPSQINPSAAGGTPAAKADMKVDAKLNNTAMNSMDTNGDGMVSRSEWDTYHSTAWNGMKPSASGVSTADVDRMNRLHIN